MYKVYVTHAMSRANLGNGLQVINKELSEFIDMFMFVLRK